jgi:hypothetical protein
VEVVDEADSEIAAVEEVVEAALTVAASATSLARRLPSKAISPRSTKSEVRPRLQQAVDIRYGTLATFSRYPCYGYLFCILPRQDSTQRWDLLSGKVCSLSHQHSAFQKCTLSYTIESLLRSQSKVIAHLRYSVASQKRYMTSRDPNGAMCG